MAYGSPHTTTVPIASNTVGPDFATQINANIAELRATLNAKVTPAGMDMNADLSMRSGGTRYGVKDVHRVSLYQQPALLNAATYPVALYSDAAGNLYYNNASGGQVQVTSGAGLAGTPGSITGLPSGTASVEFDAGSTRYEFYNATGVYAGLDVGSLYISDGSSNFLRQVAAAMAADYTVTWPAAVPASTSLMTMSAAGALALTRDPSVDTLTTTGNATIGAAATVATTLGVTGLLTASAGMTVGNNQNILLQGTGYLRHGTRTLVIAGVAFQPTNATVPTRPHATGGEVTTAGDLMCAVQLPAGLTIRSIVFHVNHSDGSNVDYESHTRVIGAANNVIDSVSVAAAGDSTVTLNTDIVTAANKMVYLRVNNSTATVTVYDVVITYDAP